jgi:hypothetical protein
MPHNTILDELRPVLNELGIARIAENEVIFLDNGTPLIELVPPPSIQRSPIIWEGLEYLRTAKPPLALLLSLHSDGTDFERLVRHAGHILRASPVCGVEAFAEAELPELGIPRPQLAQKNHWLKAFQQTQFPWMDQHDKVMLPCEPVWEGALGRRLDGLYDLFWSLPGGGPKEYSSDVRHALQHPLLVYLSIYRSWGLLGQFGHWLQEPAVQSLLDKYEGHIPVILGSGHAAERYLLQEYCELDTIALVIDRPLLDGGGSERAKIGAYYRLQGTEILHARMQTDGLSLLFPNE